VTSTSHHHPFIALFFSSNGRKIDDPRTKREIEIKSFILAQKDRRSHRETRTLRRKRMRFVAPFPRVCLGRELFKGEMIKFYRENYLSLICALPCAARARTKRHQEKKEQPESKQQRAGSTAYLVCKSDFAPERCRCQRRGCHRRRRCCVKSEENEARDL